MNTRPVIATLLALLAVSGVAAAQGLVIPDEPNLPPLALSRHAVRVEIDRQHATTTVEQVFVNHTDRQLEAQYVFPIPRGAAVSRFTMLVDGKEKSGEMVEKDKARQIYNSIVNRSRDPGLLEHLGGDIFRANVFPIAPRGSQRITVRFEQVLNAEGSLVSYVYPVRAHGKRGATVHGEFSVEVTIRSGAPILNVYSPSHAVDLSRPNDREARVVMANRGGVLDKDFRLYYGVGDKDLGLDLVTYRPDPSKPGYFMLLASPRSRRAADRPVARDIVYVVDTSGSMAGEKIKQARGALKHCLNAMNDGDRFAIARFSSFAEPWRKELSAAAEHRAAALAWADTLVAGGGTDIAGGLDTALAFPRDPARPFFVIFMTDGKPTMGETTDPLKILSKAQKADRSVRIFTWGVGYDVDTHLLDGIAAAARGVSEYVRPEEDIEAKISSFYAKASKPVLTDLELKVVGEKVQLVNLQPHALPDLYAGGQLVIVGQYTGEGDVALQLGGRVNAASETFTYEAQFPARESKQAFLELLWARRRIGHLLDQIRLHGESKELVEDVVRLSKEYGIQTPYTSMLVLENGMSLATAGEKRREGHAALDRLAAAEHQAAPTVASPVPPKAEAPKDFDEGFRKRDGRSAVDAAKYLRSLKESERAVAGAAQRACGTRFYEYRVLWVDERFEASHVTTTVKFGSAAYFRLIERRTELVEAFKISSSLVIVTATGKALIVAEEGEETLTDAQIDALFVAVVK